MVTRLFLLSVDKVESQFDAYDLGHFLLTNLLLKEGAESFGAAILNVCSFGYQMANIEFEYTKFKVGAAFAICAGKFMKPSQRTERHTNVSRVLLYSAMYYFS